MIDGQHNQGRRTRQAFADIHETLGVLPDYPTIADFLRRALGEIPGVLHMHLYVEGVVFPSSQLLEEICTESKTAGDTSSENIGRGGNNSLIILIPLQSARQKYGKLIHVRPLWNRTKGFFLHL